MLLGGEIGIGKTTLALAIPTLAPPAPLPVGRSYDLMETPPYGPWRDCFPPLAGGAGLPARAIPAQGEEPRRRRPSSHKSTPRRGDRATRLLILVLDDIQWADPASLDLFRHLAHDLAGRRILMICTYRNDELTAAHPLKPPAPPCAGCADDAHSSAPLHARECHRDGDGAVWLRAANPTLSRSVYRTTAGNPLFVREMCRALVSTRAVRQTPGGWTVISTTLPSPPETLQQLVAVRIARLETAARRVLEVAAVIGQTFTFPLLRQVLDQPEETS